MVRPPRRGHLGENPCTVVLNVPRLQQTSAPDAVYQLVRMQLERLLLQVH